jgi:hypothetical protein
MSINKKQKIALLVGFAIIVLMGLFPPWCWNIPHGGQYFHQAGQYAFLFSSSDYNYIGSEIDVTRLFIQWVVVGIATAGIMFLLKDRNGSSQQ